LLFVSIALALASLGGGGMLLLAQRRHDRELSQQLAMLARSALERRDLSSASALIQAGLARRPGDSQLLLMRGDISRAAGDYNNARTTYLTAASDSATAAEARLRLFDMALAIGAAEDAAHHLDMLEELLGADDPRVKQRRDRLKPAPAIRLPPRDAG
jgi:predicted Zn-dependent protease